VVVHSLDIFVKKDGSDEASVSFDVYEDDFVPDDDFIPLRSMNIH
jgi:hypothetical protein